MIGNEGITCRQREKYHEGEEQRKEESREKRRGSKCGKRRIF